jgi:DNA phosphorothioation-dependent restriction protein DptF
MSKLELLIEKISKSSPEAVNTLNSSFDNIVEYLHIETDIEKKYVETLIKNKDEKCLIFLCGSSGDGKSAIINKYLKQFNAYFDFHVDATHSFSPNQTAIEALSDSFDKYEKENKSLVVGINIGIMLNFINNDTNFERIGSAINKFLNKKEDSNKIYFINFEDYPKFTFDNDQIKSPFIQDLLEKITFESDSNPFYKAFLEDEEKSIIHKNYKLLSNSFIQKSIIDLLILTNLKYDQFLTVRSLLDLIYTLLKGPRLLIDQLFENESNEIIKNLKKEDPILKRSFSLDKFILERSSNKTDKKLEEYILDLNSQCIKPIFDLTSPFTLIRMFYLARNVELSNNYHLEFKNDFDDSYLHDFVELIAIHKNYDDSNKKTIKTFYKNIISSIYLYINKNLPELTKKGYIVLATNKTFTTSASINMDYNWSKIKSTTLNTFQSFPLYLKVDDVDLKPIDINLNMFVMISLINNGYRPNKHDRNTIIIFEELLESILEVATLSNKISISSKNKRTLFVKKDEEIEVENEK